MCVSCGCHEPENPHGDSRNITLLDLRSAAEAAGIPTEQAASNIVTSLPSNTAKASDGPIAEGTVLKADDENRFLLLVAYSANKMPHRGADGFIDVVRPEVLEKACWRFMDNGAKVGLWHEEGHSKAARVVENYIYRNDVPWIVQGPNDSREVIRKGDWVTGFILDEPTWALYKAGKIGGASPQGAARRREARPETLAQMTE